MQEQNKATLEESADKVNNTSGEDEIKIIDADSPETIESTTDTIESEYASSEEKELEKLTKEVELYKDKYVRLFAEFDNYKRRNAKERMELIQTAGKEVITSLLDVVDDCDRAEKQMNNSTDIDQVKEGVQLVFNKLRSTLQSKGLKAMESLDTEFDVEKHEAITEVEVHGKSKKGKVVDEIVKGYYLNDKLIRFAKVVVGK
ncbi:MAG: nucleotide exchange factor GrpE [Chitinophagaceae bacterium]|nr:nucleotide exchange factor GrpE [Chitinophagaceae bacterium]